MKAFGAIVVYMVIGGLIASLLINAIARDCGPQDVKNSDFVSFVVAWPAYLTAAIVVDDGALVSTKCGKPVETAK